MDLSTLETPCLVLDRRKLEKNITSINQRMATLGVNLRPHGKTAKNIDVLKLALEGQKGGITVSTLKEADYYFSHGIIDMVYAVGIAPVKLDRIAGLIKKGANITILLDSIAQAKFAAAKGQEHGITLPVLIEIDCDGHRSGVTLDDPLLVEIGRLLHRENGVTLAGVLTHAGGSYQCQSVDEIRAIAETERHTAVACSEILRQNGLPCPIVSVGSTPTASYAEDLTGVTEVRAGVYMFYDLVMAGLGVCEESDIAVSVLGTVIDHDPARNRLVLDAGGLALSKDRSTAAAPVDYGYGLLVREDGSTFGRDLVVVGVSQEHGVVSSQDPLPYAELPVGSRVRVLPNHVCMTAASYDRYYVTDGHGDAVVDEWHKATGW